MQLVIISGKGGTGKTTIAASFAYLSENSIKCDCDVDASNLH
ncbi:nucleotide-binding protein, partial [Vallitalea guaymasensis]